MRFIRSKLTFANVVALLALFVALGGSAYAIHLGKNAVKTRNIKNGAVVESKLAPGAVSSSKIVDRAVSAAKLAPGAVTASGLGQVVVHHAFVSLPDGAGSSANVFCGASELPIGSVARVLAQGEPDVAFEGSEPVHTNTSTLTEGEPLRPGDGFTAAFHNASGGFTAQTSGEVTVLCLK
jgi:hypothetical protein